MAINLKKGQKISLVKENGGKGLSKVILGLGWDEPDSGRACDLDANAVLFDAGGNVVEKIWFRNTNKNDQAGIGVAHTGDNLTGAGDGDDEQIIVDLDKVAAGVTAIVFTVASYSGHTFNEVKNAFIRVVNGSNHSELAKYILSDGFKETGVIMGRLYRHGGEWKFAALGLPANGQTVNDQIDTIKRTALS